jgi:hypothetical protein
LAMVRKLIINKIIHDQVNERAILLEKWKFQIQRKDLIETFNHKLEE